MAGATFPSKRNTTKAATRRAYPTYGLGLVSNSAP